MKQRIRKPRLSLSKAEIAKIDALRKKHRDELRRGMPKDVAYYYERRDSGRTCRQACADLLRSGIPMSRGLRLLAGLHMLEGDELKKWQRAWDVEGTFALDIARDVELVTGLLRDAGYKDAKTRAAEYVSQRHWRGVRSFANGEALTKWLWRHKRPDEAL